jgi:hypothetical protein
LANLVYSKVRMTVTVQLKTKVETLSEPHIFSKGKRSNMKHKNNGITSSVPNSRFDLKDVLDDASVYRPFQRDLSSDVGAGVRLAELTSLKERPKFIAEQI